MTDKRPLPAGTDEGEKITMTLSVPRSLKKRLQRYALDRDETLSAVAERILEEGLEVLETAAQVADGVKKELGG